MVLALNRREVATTSTTATAVVLVRVRRRGSRSKRDPSAPCSRLAPGQPQTSASCRGRPTTVLLEAGWPPQGLNLEAARLLRAGWPADQAVRAPNYRRFQSSSG